MSVSKAQMKQSILQNIGSKVDDMLEGVEKQRNAHNGAKQALAQIASNIAGLAKLAEKEHEEGTLPDSFGLPELGVLKRFIGRAQMMAETAAQNQENLEISTGGKVEALAQVVRVLKKEHDAEAAKEQAIKDLLVTGDHAVVSLDDARTQGGQRPTGLRPAPSIAAERRAEAKRAEPAKAAKRKRKRGKKNGVSDAPDAG